MVLCAVISMPCRLDADLGLKRHFYFNIVYSLGKKTAFPSKTQPCLLIKGSFCTAFVSLISGRTAAHSPALLQRRAEDFIVITLLKYLELYSERLVLCCHNL